MCRQMKLHELVRAAQDVRAANVRALSDSLVLTCHREDFQTHLGRLTDIRRLWRFEALRKVPLSRAASLLFAQSVCCAVSCSRQTCHHVWGHHPCMRQHDCFECNACSDVCSGCLTNACCPEA